MLDSKPILAKFLIGCSIEARAIGDRLAVGCFHAINTPVTRWHKLVFLQIHINPIAEV
ncbi:MAG TPA: hypothetical protein IGS17_12715 [Oscillatoriales cyanobacterium M59_W2019_021]|nr:hypothetical protein [Oscillatoriales cyanobacterium M4454_W2019_049]HIK51766.1 hypothetical protein [Oscillatoriales cyanobacterium M59_W2019_021]